MSTKINPYKCSYLWQQFQNPLYLIYHLKKKLQIYLSDKLCWIFENIPFNGRIRNQFLNENANYLMNTYFHRHVPTLEHIRLSRQRKREKQHTDDRHKVLCIQMTSHNMETNSFIYRFRIRKIESKYFCDICWLNKWVVIRTGEC